jgi:hypothetical protein
MRKLAKLSSHGLYIETMLGSRWPLLGLIKVEYFSATIPSPVHEECKGIVSGASKIPG